MSEYQLPDFDEYVGDLSAPEAQRLADSCQFRDGQYCDASSPSGAPQCLLCKTTSCPDDHPWIEKIKAWKAKLVKKQGVREDVRICPSCNHMVCMIHFVDVKGHVIYAPTKCVNCGSPVLTDAEVW